MSTLHWPAPAYVHYERFVALIPNSMRPILSCCQPPPESHLDFELSSICRRRLQCYGVLVRTTYWRLTLQYGIDGNLQAVLDEYVHVLRESLGLQEHSPEEQVARIAECIQSVLSLRTAQIRIDEINAVGDGFIVDNFNTRCRFALRFGDIRDDNNQALVRADSVRDAFNSPFRPFILASTSIGPGRVGFSHMVSRGRYIGICPLILSIWNNGKGECIVTRAMQSERMLRNDMG